MQSQGVGFDPWNAIQKGQLLVEVEQNLLAEDEKWEVVLVWVLHNFLVELERGPLEELVKLHLPALHILARVAANWPWKQNKMNPRRRKVAENLPWSQKMMNLMAIEDHLLLMAEIPLALHVLVAEDERKLEMALDLQEVEMVVGQWVELGEVELDEQREIVVLDNAGRGVPRWVGHMLLVEKSQEDH